jgi:hypothetical protein
MIMLIPFSLKRKRYWIFGLFRHLQNITVLGVHLIKHLIFGSFTKMRWEIFIYCYIRQFLRLLYMKIYRRIFEHLEWNLLKRLSEQEMFGTKDSLKIQDTLQVLLASLVPLRHDRRPNQKMGTLYVLFLIVNFEQRSSYHTRTAGNN